MKDASADVILICTTEEGLNGHITRILEPIGFKLISALNQHMLFSLIELHCPLIVIADSGLSAIMGYTTCEIIKGVDRFRNIKIVLITKDELQRSKDAYEYVDDIIDRDSVSANLLSTVCNYSS